MESALWISRSARSHEWVDECRHGNAEPLVLLSQDPFQMSDVGVQRVEQPFRRPGFQPRHRPGALTHDPFKQIRCIDAGADLRVEIQIGQQHEPVDPASQVRKPLQAAKEVRIGERTRPNGGRSVRRCRTGENSALRQSLVHPDHLPKNLALTTLAHPGIRAQDKSRLGRAAFVVVRLGDGPSRGVIHRGPD